MLATQKSLYNYKPDDAVNQVPDLAESDPQISEDGKTVTVKIKSGVKFSPPVNREVTSKDVKYAIERGFFNTVNNGYAGAYFGDLEGAEGRRRAGAKIKGITTPDDTTIVFHLTKGVGGVLAGALALPLSAPVPEEYAAKFDKQEPVELRPEPGRDRSVHDRERRLPARRPATSRSSDIHLVRNPNWDKARTSSPAYLDEIDMPQGNDDTDRGVAQDPRRRSSMVNGDFSPPPADPQAGRHEAKGPARARADRRRPLGRDEHHDQAVRRRQRAPAR